MSAPVSAGGTLSVAVTVTLVMGIYWARAGTGLRFRAAASRRSGPDAVKKAAADFLGCQPAEVILAKAAPGVFTATCSAAEETVA